MKLKATNLIRTLALSLALVGAGSLLGGAGICYGQESSRKVVKKVAAQYPQVLRQRGIGGVVKLRVLVAANGSVKDAQVAGGNAILADCAQKAVKQWTFTPAGADSYVDISVVFDPNSPVE
jgi:TonB family protein